MCLGIPAKILHVNGDFAEASINGASIRIGLHLVEDIAPGDYVLIHAGYALEKLSIEDAQASLDLIRQLNDASANLSSDPV